MCIPDEAEISCVLSFDRPLVIAFIQFLQAPSPEDKQQLEVTTEEQREAEKTESAQNAAARSTAPQGEWERAQQAYAFSCTVGSDQCDHCPQGSIRFGATPAFSRTEPLPVSRRRPEGLEREAAGDREARSAAGTETRTVPASVPEERHLRVSSGPLLLCAFTIAYWEDSCTTQQGQEKEEEADQTLGPATSEQAARPETEGEKKAQGEEEAEGRESFQRDEKKEEQHQPDASMQRT